MLIASGNFFRLLTIPFARNTGILQRLQGFMFQLEIYLCAYTDKNLHASYTCPLHSFLY